MLQPRPDGPPHPDLSRGRGGTYHGDLYLFEDTDRPVGVLGNVGIDAPTVAMLIKELVRDGVEAFLSVGLAGCLAESIDTGAVVVCERAIRDEGTSDHYAEPGTDDHPSDPSSRQ